MPPYDMAQTDLMENKGWSFHRAIRYPHHIVDDDGETSPTAHLVPAFGRLPKGVDESGNDALGTLHTKIYVSRNMNRKGAQESHSGAHTSDWPMLGQATHVEHHVQRLAFSPDRKYSRLWSDS